MSYQKDRDEFVGVIVGEVISQGGRADTHSVDLARAILRDAATMQRLAVEACNRELTDGEKRQDDRCQLRIEAACTPWGIKPTFNGDPRGNVVKLLLPSGRWNSWGGKEDGYCVPTR